MNAQDREFVLSIEGNRECMECGTKHPDWCSVNHGILLCLQCSGSHRGLGVHISVVKSLTLDSWTQEQVNSVKAGGNALLKRYFQEHNILRNNIGDKYSSSVAQTYRDELAQRAIKQQFTPPFYHQQQEQQEQHKQVHKKDTKGELTLTHEHHLGWRDAFPTVFIIIMEQIGLGHWEWKVLGKTIFMVTIAVIGVGTILSTKNNSLLLLLQGSSIVLLLLLLLILPYLAVTALAMRLSQQFVHHRQAAFPSAKLRLIKRLRSRRMERLPRFDVYLPPTTSTTNKNTDANNTEPQEVPGLIFFPGALVEHAAYAPWAAQLSDQGILVVVVSLEPLRVATLHHGANDKDILPILYHVAQHYADKWTVTEWALGGHSAGGSCAFDLVQRLNMKKLILLASHSPITLKQTHLVAVDRNRTTTTKNQNNVKVLCVDATQDGILARETPARLRHFKDNMVPKDTIYYTIKGGNHSGFGHYGPQTYPRKDGTRTISLLEQQRQCVQVCASFLLSKDYDNTTKDYDNVHPMPMEENEDEDEKKAQIILERVLAGGGDLDPDDESDYEFVPRREEDANKQKTE